MSTPPIYLDNHSTTKPDPRVVAAMMPYFTEIYGNAASVSHRFGWDAEEAVEKARTQVASALGAEPREIVFTAGATEANNLAIKGALPFLRRKGDHIIATAVEHKSVLDVVERLGCETDWKVTIVPCDNAGLVSLDAVQAAVRPETVLVSVMTANNEVGTVNPIREIGVFCHGRGIVFHTDATQAVGKIPIDVGADHIDLLSLSAHKLYGPKGIGALYVRRKGPQVRIKPLFDGGGHERGMRSGTPAVPLIVGLGEAVSLAIREREADADRIRALRDRLEALIRANVLDVTLNGHATERLDGNLNMSFAYVDGEALMMAMRDIAVSSGAACSSAEPEPSHVLRAMGRDDDSARASLRFGLGRFTTAEEIDRAAEFVANAVAALRVHSSAWAASGKISSDEPHPS